MAPTSKPKFVTKPPIRPRRIRADGISREPAERRKPVESESENVSRKSIIVDKSVNNCWDRLAIMKTRVWERLIVICIDKQNRFNEKLIHSGWQMQVHWLDHLLCSQHQRYLSPQAYHLLHSWLTLSALIPFSLILQVVNHHRNRMTAAFGKLRKDDIQAELCIVVCSMIRIKSQDLRHRSTLVKMEPIFRDSHN